MAIPKNLAHLKNWAIEIGKGEVLISQGSKSEAMFILLDGSLDVIVNRKKVGELSHSGTYIGEISFLLKDSYTATCIAAKNSQLIRIDAAIIEKFIHSSPSVIESLAQQMAKRISEVDKDFTELQNRYDISNDRSKWEKPEDSREWLAKTSDLKDNTVKLAKGEILIAEGTHARSLFALKSGALLLSKKGKEIYQVTEPGEFVGEVGFILEMKHTWSCTAACHSEVIRIERSAFIQRLETNPKFGELFLASLARHLVNLSNKLSSHEKSQFYSKSK